MAKKSNNMKNCNLFNRPFFAIEQSKLDEMNATKKGSAFGLFVPSKTDNKYLYVSGMIKQNQSSMDDNSKIKLNMYKTDCSVDPNKLTKNIAMHVLTTVITRIFLTSLSLFKLHFIDFFPLFSYPVDTGSRQSRVRKKGEFYVSK